MGSNVPNGFSNKASSLRFTGAPDDWKYDTINLYFQEYFIGDEEFTYNDAPTLNYSTRQSLGSLAATVSSVKRGCYAQERRMPDNQRLRGMAANSTQGFFP